MRCSTSCIHAVVPSCRLFPILNMPCFPTPKQLNNTCQSHYRIVASKRGTPSPCSFRILTRLNHFNLRLRPIGLRPSCLTFGVTSACPMFAIRWLTYLAGTGFPPAGIIDLARPHTPLVPFGFGIDYKTEQEFAHIMIFFEKIGFLEAKDNCVKVSTETVIH